MWLINILALLFTSFLIAYLFKEDICDTLPIMTGVLILILYILAFFRCLNRIDIIACMFLFILAVLIFLLKRERRKDILSSFVSTMLHPQMIILLVAFILLTLSVKDQVAVWWDDINYWATDVKSLYFLNGFAGKYGNVAPEFGDYPPVVQLFKWWFLHFRPHEFKEGFMFAGYYCLNVIFLLSLLKKLKTKNVICQFVACISLFLIPGIVNGIYFSGTSSDITMGIVYGAVLWAIWDYKCHTSLFYYIRITVYLCVLVLTKSVGFEWVCFAVLFFILFYRKWKENEEIPFQNGNRIKIFFMLALPVLTQAGWMLFCLMRRRIAKLTSTGIHMAVDGKYTIPDNAIEKMGYFLKGFSLYPMHADKTWGIDLSALMLIIIFILVIVGAKRKKVLENYEAGRMLLFVGITALASYGIIFIAHITIFAGELQYLDAAVMAISIARYGAPFTLGLLYLLFGLLISRTQVKKAYIICLTFILLTTNFVGVYRTLYGYRNDLENVTTANKDMIDDGAKRFLTVTDGESEIWGKRVLYLRDDNTIHWVKDTYVNYEASPIAVVYNGIATDRMTQSDIITKIKESHASYLYVDEVAGDAVPLFEGMMVNGDFEYDTLYRVYWEQDNIVLEKMKGLK